MSQSPAWGDHLWDLLYKANANLEPYVSNFTAPAFGDHLWDLAYKLSENIQNIGGGSGGLPGVVSAPSSLTDFSMFPGGVAPTSGTYLAADDNWLYSFDTTNGDTEWHQSARST